MGAAGIDLDGLLALGGRGGVDIRPALLRVTTDLYVAKETHSAEEEKHYAALALRLLDLVDAETRETVTAKLRACREPPPTLRALLGDAPAAPAFDRGNAAGELHTLFMTADAETRRLILFALDDAAWAPASITIDADTPARLEVAALSQDRSGFATILAEALGIDPRLAQTLVADASGEPVVAAARALAMPDTMLQRVLLCLDPAIARSVEQVYRLSDLYEEVRQEAALRLVALWREVRVADERAAENPRETDDELFEASQDDAASSQAPSIAVTCENAEDAVYAVHRVTSSSGMDRLLPAAELWAQQDRPAFPTRPGFRWDAVTQVA